MKLFDEVLAECGESPLLENENFSRFLNFSISSCFLVMELNSSKANTLPIVIWFEADSLRIDIEEMNESFDWSRKQIQEKRAEIINLIKSLFIGFVSIESHKSSRFIQIFDADGFFVRSFSYNNLFHMITGIYLFRHKNVCRIYLPNFTKLKK